MSSVVVGDQRPGDRGASLVVVPDGGGQGQDALADADGDAFEGAPTVGLQVELALEGVVHRFDQLADRFEHRLAGPRRLVFAGGPQQGDAAAGRAGRRPAAARRRAWRSAPRVRRAWGRPAPTGWASRPGW